VIIAGHAFMQNLRRGHYEIAVDAPLTTRVAAAFTELANAIGPGPGAGFTTSTDSTTQRRPTMSLVPNHAGGPSFLID
jgi:hypothetical protein